MQLIIENQFSSPILTTAPQNIVFSLNKFYDQRVFNPRNNKSSIIRIYKLKLQTVFTNRQIHARNVLLVHEAEFTFLGFTRQWWYVQLKLRSICHHKQSDDSTNLELLSSFKKKTTIVDFTNVQLSWTELQSMLNSMSPSGQLRAKNSFTSDETVPDFKIPGISSNSRVTFHASDMRENYQNSEFNTFATQNCQIPLESRHIYRQHTFQPISDSHCL